MTNTVSNTNSIQKKKIQFELDQITREEMHLSSVLSIV